MTNPWQPRLWWIWPSAVGLVLLLQLQFPESGTGVLHDTYSPTAEGSRAFYRLVDAHAGWTERNSQPLSRILPRGHCEPTLCILGPERFPTDREWDAILDWVADGGELLFAFRGFEEQVIPRLKIRYVPRSGPLPPDDSLLPETDLTDSPGIAWWTDGRLVAPDTKTLVRYDDTVQAVSGELGYGRFVVSATSLVFSNQLLTYGDNPILAMRLLEQTSDLDGITFDESLNGTGTPKAVGLLFDREMRPLTLQLILITLLYGWWNFQRFGPVWQLSVGKRQNIVEHTNALGIALWRARAGQLVLQAYWKLMQRDVPSLRRAALSRKAETLAATQLGWEPHEVRELLDEVTQAEANENLDRRAAASLIRRLARLRRVIQPNLPPSGQHH